MPNSIKPISGTPLWYGVYKTDESPNSLLENIFKLEYPANLLDNSSELLNRDSICTDTKVSMENHLASESVDLNGKTIPD